MTRGFIRYAVGVAISAVAVAAIVAQVEVPAVAAALRHASFATIGLALLLVVGEVLLRALRWLVLLRPLVALPFREAVAYLCIGYFANAILPARLGDVTRAYLAGTRFGIRRTTTMGTIFVERIGDGLLMLFTVLVLGSISEAGRSLIGVAFVVLMLGAATAAILLLSITGARRSRIADTSWWALVEGLLARLWAGTAALARPATAAAVVTLTLVAFAVAVAVMVTVAGAFGVELSPLEAVLTTAGLALSLSIPAAPGALGTYELVGMTLLASVGVPREQALAIVVVQHAAVLVPPTLAGMVATWIYQVRVADPDAFDASEERGTAAIPSAPDGPGT